MHFLNWRDRVKEKTSSINTNASKKLNNIINQGKNKIIRLTRHEWITYNIFMTNIDVDIYDHKYT